MLLNKVTSRGSRDSGFGRWIALFKKGLLPSPASRVPHPAYLLLLFLTVIVHAAPKSVVSWAVAAPSLSPCDMNADRLTNVSDVQLCANQAIGSTVCSSGDINRDSLCNVVDVQRVVNAALGGQCVTQ